MNYFSDYLDIDTYSRYEYPPKFYVDFYYLKPNLKINYIDSKEFTVSLGVLNFHVNVTFKWSYVERPKTELELQREKRVQEVLEKSR